MNPHCHCGQPHMLLTGKSQVSNKLRAMKDARVCNGYLYMRGWRQTDVLIWLGFKTKNPQIKLLNNRSLSSLSSGGCKSKFKVQKDCSLLRLLFLSCKHPSSPWVCAFCVCVLTALKNIIIITINVFVCVYDVGVHMVQRACGGQKSPLWGHFPLPFTHWTISPVLSLFFSRVLVVLN